MQNRGGEYRLFKESSNHLLYVESLPYFHPIDRNEAQKLLSLIARQYPSKALFLLRSSSQKNYIVLTIRKPNGDFGNYLLDAYYGLIKSKEGKLFLLREAIMIYLKGELQISSYEEVRANSLVIEKKHGHTAFLAFEEDPKNCTYAQVLNNYVFSLANEELGKELLASKKKDGFLFYINVNQDYDQFRLHLLIYNHLSSSFVTQALSFTSTSEGFPLWKCDSDMEPSSYHCLEDLIDKLGKDKIMLPVSINDGKIKPEPTCSTVNIFRS